MNYLFDFYTRKKLAFSKLRKSTLLSGLNLASFVF